MSSKTAGPTFFPPLGPPKMAGAVNPKGWDRCALAGQVLPGHASILRGGIKLKKDHKPKSGADGCRPTYHGIDPGELELEVITYSDDDREALAGIVATVMPVPGKEPKPVSIDYPGIRHLGISTVLVIGVSALIPIGPGVAKMTLQLDHWMPPKASSKIATKTPTRAVRNARKEAAQKNSNPSPTAQKGPGPTPTGATTITYVAGPPVFVR